MKKMAFLLCVITFLSCNSRTIFLNSIPKCGTHLTLRCLRKLIKKSFFTCSGWTNLKQKEVNALHGKIYKAHALHTAANQRIVLNNRLKSLFVIRDPRAQVVSMAKWVKKHPHTWEKYRYKSLRDVIKELIVDCSDIYTTQFEADELKRVKTVTDFYHLYLGWVDTEGVMIVRFEDLVGFHGGSCESLQIQTIEKIANHIDVVISEEEVKEISRGLFGVSSTFSTGQISGWRDFFDEDVIALFKECGGSLLIELGYEADLDW